MRGGAFRLALVALALGFGFGCTKVNSRYCADHVKHDCTLAKLDAGTDAHVDAADGVGDTADGGDVAEAGDATDAHEDAEVAMDLVPEKPMCSPMSCPADKPICDMDAGTCNLCASNTECIARDPLKPGCGAGQCYVCVTAAECTGHISKPICEAHDCRACKADAECDGPGICQDDGNCTPANQVLFVDFNASGCAGADATTTKPFCNPSDAVAAVAASKGNTIVIRGPASGQVAIDAPITGNVTIVGKKNAAGESPSIPLGVLTGIRVSTGTVLIRDLSITGGTAASAKGVTVGGATTTVTLRRLTIDTGLGLGVQADTGASLFMDACIVKDNAIGGLSVNGAFYDVANSVFATNGYGVKFNVPKAMSKFRSNTIVANSGIAATCDTNDAQPLMGSIVAGFVDTCMLIDSLTVAPTFDAARPFHLTAKAQCPMNDPMSFPDHDIDGDPRATPVDCGADQFR
jgi:hypothetical protein